MSAPHCTCPIKGDPATHDPGCPFYAKPKSLFLQATEALIIALDLAEGLSARHLRCFQFNFHQFAASLIEKAEAEETARKFPMGRHDWGKNER